MNKKLKSFTISELLVVLIIASIVVGIAFSVLDLSRKEIQKINENKDLEVKINQAELKLTIDMNSFSKCSVSDNYLFFKNEIDSIQYQILGGNLISREDTLLSNIVEVNYFFKGNKINNEVFDALKLVVETKKDINSTVFVCKNNDALNDLN